MDKQLVKFLRQRDYEMVRELGRGACGITVLLHDDIIGEFFVCKKYEPIEHSDFLFQNFVKEIGIMHHLQHNNVVRFYNYFVYPESAVGYILMEYVDGTDLFKFASQSPHKINDAFLQTVSGFKYLEEAGVLHRDIRPENILVSVNSVVKIIDLGFAKKVCTATDFEKSISLNWYCEPPDEFESDIYNFTTEVYFVGRIFYHLVKYLGVPDFAYGDVLAKMCSKAPDSRFKSFSDVEKQALRRDLLESGFSDAEKAIYQRFVRKLTTHLLRVSQNVKYTSDGQKLMTLLEGVYASVSLEEFIPDAKILINCIVNSSSYTLRRQGFPVPVLKEFLQLLRSADSAKLGIIIANLHTRLDSIDREDPFDDVPF